MEIPSNADWSILNTPVNYWWNKKLGKIKYSGQKLRTSHPAHERIDVLKILAMLKNQKIYTFCLFMYNFCVNVLYSLLKWGVEIKPREVFTRRRCLNTPL